MGSARRFLPNLPMSTTVICWAFNFVALKLVYEQMTAPAVSLVRFALMYAILVGLCVWQKQSLRVDAGDFWRIMVGTFLSMGVYMVLFLEGMRGTSPAEGAIVVSTAPIWTSLLSAASGQERFSPGTLIGAIVALIGVSMVVLNGGAATSGALFADFILLLSAIVWALSTVVLRPLLGRYSPLRMLTVGMPAALVVLLPYGWSAVGQVRWTEVNLQGWIMFLHVAVMSGVVAFIGFYRGIQELGATGATLYQFFVPPLAAFFGFLVMKSALHWMQLVGILVVIAGVAYASRSRFRALQAAAP